MPTLSLNGTSANDDGSVTPGIFLPDGIGGRNFLGLYSSVYPMSNWYRFPSVTVPQGATVNTAYLQLVVLSYSAGNTNVNIYGHKTTNSSQPSSESDYYTRTRTTANTGTWNIGTPGAGATIQSPSLAAILQEIFGQAGWVSGNALTLLCDYVTSTDQINFDDYDTGTKPLLYIDYTASAGGTSITRSIFTSFIR